MTVSNQPLQVSIILPVFEEEDTIEGVVVEIIETLADSQYAYEIIAVEDGSQDRSLAILKQLQERYPARIRIAHHKYNKGYGSSLRTGIHIARGDIVVCMDADGQHTAKSIPELIELISEYDMAVGYRTENYQGSWYRNLGNRFYNWFASWLTSFKVMDLTSGFRAMRRETVSHFLTLYPARFSASLTVTMAFLKAGYTLTYVPVHVHPRAGGKSKVNFIKDGSAFFMMLLRMIMLYDPLRIFLPISGGLVFLGTLAWVLGIFHEGRLIFPNSTIFLFSAALLTVLLGLISNQLVSTRIHYYGDEAVTIYDDEKDQAAHP